MAEYKDDRVDLTRSAADILNPSIDAIELKEQDPLVIAPLSPDNLTAEDLEEEAKAKQDFYAKENLERQGQAGKGQEETVKQVEERTDVTTSGVDKGQEALLSPEAEKVVKESTSKSKASAK